MAFTQQGTPITPNTGVQAAPADPGLAVLIGGATDAASFIGGAAAAISQDQLEIKSDKTVGTAIEGILGLQEERDVLLGRQRSVSQDIASISADGEITDDERDILGGLELEKRFLDEARRSGVLSRQGFSTRYNTLFRSALSSAENLGIQGQIGQLFLNNRSMVEGAPVQDPAQAKLEAAMNAQFGENNWTATKAAEFASTQVRADAVMRGVETNTNALVGAMKTDLEVMANTMITGSASRGIITADEQQNYEIAVNTSVVQNIKNLDEKRQLLRTEGIYTPSAQKRIDAAQAQLLAVRDSYLGVFRAEGRHEGFTASEALKRTQTAVDKMNQLNLSMNSKMISGAASGTSSLGKMGSDLMMSILQEDPKQSRLLQTLAEASTIPGMTPEKMHRQAAETLSVIMSGGASLADAHRTGQINTDMLRYFSATLTAEDTSTPEESEAQQTVTNELANVGLDLSDTAANIQTIVQVFDGEASNAKRNDTTSTHKANTLDRLKRLSIDLIDKSKRKSSLTISINDEGLPTVQLRPEFGGDLGIVPASAKRADQVLRTALASYAALSKKAIAEGYLTPSDIQKHFGTGIQVFDVTTGAGETAAAAARREATVQAPVETAQPQSTASIVELPAGVTETVDVDTAVAIQLESSGDPEAVNEGSGAAGLLQLTPERAAEEGIDPLDPDASIQVFKAHSERVKPVLSSIGEEPSGFNAYLLWQQGVRGGIDILTSQDLKISSLSKSRQRNLASNPPPTKGWEAAKGKPEVKVSKWVSEWEKHYNSIASKG
jgi:hypothetical protein